MSDYFLQLFWKQVKDPQWPDVNTWDDFLQINDQIKSECMLVHGLEQRLSEIEDTNYWAIRSYGEWFRKDRFIFVNVPKCGSTHYFMFFLGHLGWEHFFPTSLDELDGYVTFGLMMHPLEKYLKGITEFIWAHELAGRIDLEKFVTNALMPDLHSIPYFHQFGELMDDIHWIPFQTMKDHQVKSCMNSLFAHYNSTMTIPVDFPRVHESPNEKLAIFNEIKHHWQNRKEPQPSRDKFNNNLYGVYHAFAQDLKFYRKLIENFKSDWSHLKTTQ